MTEYRLGDLLIIKNGKDHKTLSDGNIPVLGSGGLMRYVNKALYNGESILLPRKGSLENIQYINKPFWTVDTLYYSIVHKEKANAFYLYNYLKKLDLSKLNSGTGVPSMTFGAYYDVKVHLPDLPTQQKIASVLSALDNKIELNNKINAELEAMAKTLYDYWFVQFDFPDAVGKPYKSCGGEMVYNEVLKREIPKGWENGSLDDLGEIIGGSTPPREIQEYFSKTGTAWITPKDLSKNKGNKFIAHGELDVSEKGIKNASLRIMPKGTILLSTRAPVGYLAISHDLVTTNQGFKSFVPNKGYSSEFTYYTVENLIPTIENNAVGSTFKEISASTLKGIRLCLPDKNVIDDYNKIIVPIFNKQKLLEKQNQELASLRDWILPMLMNGQVTVKDAYKRVEEELGMVVEGEGVYKRMINLRHV